jgi:hypothetical protein
MTVTVWPWRLACLAALFFVAISAQAEDFAASGKGWRLRNGGVWILALKGTEEEMAAQHGALARDHLQESALPYFSGRIERSIRQAYLARELPTLGNLALWGIRRWVTYPLIHRLPQATQRRIEAFARAAGVPVRAAEEAEVVPDVGQWLVTQIFHRQSVAEGFFTPISPFGCSTFVAADAANPQGWIHARNLDYDGYGIFERQPAVMYLEPTEPGAQKIISFTSLGLHTYGITGINESGIALSLHQTMVDAVSRFGAAILAVNEQILREAHTLDEAVAILKSYKFAGSWGVHLSSYRERRSVSVEVSADGADVLWHEGGSFAATNHIRGTLAKTKEFSFSQRYYEDSLLRLVSLTRGVEASTGRGMTLQDAVGLISGTSRPTATGVEADQSVHGIVAKLNNIQSVVMAPQAGLALIGVPGNLGGKPTEGAYVPVPLRWPGDAEPEEFVRSAAASGMPPPVATAVTDERVRAHEAVRHAAHLAAEVGDFDGVIRDLETAAASEPQEVTWAVLRAVAGFRHAFDGALPEERRARLDRAMEWIRRARGLHPDAYHGSLLTLFEGRYLDLIGDRAGALAAYATVDGRYSKELARQALKQARSPYAFTDLDTLVLDTVHGDVYRF